MVILLLLQPVHRALVGQSGPKGGALQQFQKHQTLREAGGRALRVRTIYGVQARAELSVPKGKGDEPGGIGNGRGRGGTEGAGDSHLMKRAYSGRRQYCRYSRYSAKAGRSNTFACARSAAYAVSPSTPSGGTARGYSG